MDFDISIYNIIYNNKFCLVMNKLVKYQLYSYMTILVAYMFMIFKQYSLEKMLKQLIS